LNLPQLKINKKAIVTVAEVKVVVGMEKSGEDVVVLDRASRATRGKRLTKLLDDEIQEDELFWNQEALKDEDEDDNYQEEPEIADEFDSDFDEDVFRNIFFQLFCAFSSSSSSYLL